jgi:hypothetical protein
MCPPFTDETLWVTSPWSSADAAKTAKPFPESHTARVGLPAQLRRRIEINHLLDGQTTRTPAEPGPPRA